MGIKDTKDEHLLFEQHALILLSQLLSSSDEGLNRENDGYHMRKENLNVWWGPEVPHMDCWFPLGWYLKEGCIEACAAAHSVSWLALYHCWSDAKLRQCPITSQQISHRHAIAINSRGYPEWRLRDSWLHSYMLPQMFLNASSQRPT